MSYHLPHRRITLILLLFCVSSSTSRCLLAFPCRVRTLLCQLNDNGYDNERFIISVYELPESSRTLVLFGGRWVAERTKTRTRRSMMLQKAAIRDYFHRLRMAFQVILQGMADTLHNLDHILPRAIRQFLEHILPRDTHHKDILRRAIPLRAILRADTLVTLLHLMATALAWGRCLQVVQPPLRPHTECISWRKGATAEATALSPVTVEATACTQAMDTVTVASSSTGSSSTGSSSMGSMERSGSDERPPPRCGSRFVTTEHHVRSYAVLVVNIIRRHCASKLCWLSYLFPCIVQLCLVS